MSPHPDGRSAESAARRKMDRHAETSHGGEDEVRACVRDRAQCARPPSRPLIPGHPLTARLSRLSCSAAARILLATTIPCS